MSKKMVLQKSLFILGGCFLLAVIIGIIVSQIKSNQTSGGSSPPCKDIGMGCSPTSGEKCCDSNAICTLDSNTQKSTCQFVHKCIKIGENCNDSPYSCCANLYCDTSQNKCTQCTNIGDNCKTDVGFGPHDSCCGNSYCDTSKKKCTQCTNIGDNCKTDEQCCDLNASCANNTCCKKNSSNCTQNSDCCSNYCLNGICNCKQLEAKCEPNIVNPECCPGTYCNNNNTCTTCTGGGDKCETDEQCCGHYTACGGGLNPYCKNKKCTSCKDLYAKCDNPSDCCNACQCVDAGAGAKHCLLK